MKSGSLILFCPHNKYHAETMILVARKMDAIGVSSNFLSVDKYHGEGAEVVFKREGVEYHEFDRIQDIQKYDLIFVMNDWGGVVKSLVCRANLYGIPTVGLVEGVQDFEDSHIPWWRAYKRRKPYQRVKKRLFASNYDLKFFPTSDYISVVGVPRFRYLFEEDVASSSKVLVNLNFSYGVFSKASAGWLDDVKHVLRKMNKEYIISKHPKDNTPVKGDNISKNTLHDDLACSDIVISRFSTVILEALLMNKKVIYYNPHGERVDKFESSMGAYLVAKNKSELFDRMQTWSNNDVCLERVRAFLKLHLSVGSMNESLDRISLALREILTQKVDGKKGFRLVNFLRFRRQIFHAFVGRDFNGFFV